jgi:hypothetical protein
MMLAYKCHACPLAWAREHSVRVALTPRSRPFLISDRADPSCPAVRNDLLSAHVLLFLSPNSTVQISRVRDTVILQRCDLGLQDAEKCVAWGVNKRKASLFEPVRFFSCPRPGFRRRHSHQGVTGSGRWTSSLLWRRRHVDLTRRSRGPTVTRAIALQDYS